MPGPLAKGVIIAASVLVAASIAAYENPQFREWLERSTQKVALAFKSIGDDLNGKRRTKKSDSSMHEDMDEKAEERRRQARQEIMEKGRALQEKRKKRPSSTEAERSPSFDSLVDEEGRLRDQTSESESNPWAASTGIQPQSNEGLRSRNEYPQMHESVDAPILLRQLNSADRSVPIVAAVEPWESQYEQEMRNAWNIDLPARPNDVANSHASESLIDLTPTTEDFPDPDYSIPSLTDAPHLTTRTQYFSAAASQSSQALSRDDDWSGGIDLSQPLTPLEPRPFTPHDNQPTIPLSQASLAGSTAHISHSDAELTDDDFSDEFGDGIRTPASAWTEVASSVSGDD